MTAALPVPNLLVLFAGIALAAGPHLPRLPIWISVMTVALLVWRGWAIWRALPLPRKWLLYLLAVAGLVGVWFTYRTLFGRDAGVALLVVLVTLKLLEMRTLRDVVVVTFLCYFLALTNFFYSQTMPTGALIFATALVLTTGLAGFHAPRRTVRENARTAGLLMAQGVPVMLAVFFLFPRVQGPLWGMPADAFSGMTGLSDSMTPGSISNLILSDAIAFRVKFDGDAPDRRRLYWRGPVFWEFDGRTWRGGDIRVADTVELEERQGPFAYSVVLEPHDRGWLFALEMPDRVPPRAWVTRDYQLLSREPVRARRRYEMVSFLQYRATGGARPFELAAALALPPDSNPQAAALARAWREEGKTDDAVVARAIAWFQGAGLRYSLAPPLTDRNPVDEFLFGSKTGFCEHFASAFAFLMRAAGVPARVVTGYQGGEVNPVDDWFIVRQSDAHAWAEVSLPERGWVRVDPTAIAAPLRVDGGLAAAMPADESLPLFARADLSWLHVLRLNWEAVNNYWNLWVLGYDPDRQREMLSRLGMRSPDWQQMTTVLFWMVGAVLLAVAAGMLRRTRPVDPAQAVWLRFCAKLARRGVQRRASEGPAAFAARAVEARPARAQEVAAIAGLYVELRYGPAPQDAMLARLRALVRGFRA